MDTPTITEGTAIASWARTVEDQKGRRPHHTEAPRGGVWLPAASVGR